MAFSKKGPSTSKLILRDPPPPLNYQTHRDLSKRTEGKNQALVGAIPFGGEYPGPRFEDKFQSANQLHGISKAGEDKHSN